MKQNFKYLVFMIGLSSIIGCSTDNIPTAPELNSVSLPGVATFSYLKNSLNEKDIKITKTNEMAYFEAIDEAGSIYDIQESASYQVKINIGKELPENISSLDVAFVVPEILVPSAGSNLRAFAHIEIGNDLDVMNRFVTVPASYIDLYNQVNAKLPIIAFSNKNTDDGSYEAVLTLAKTSKPVIQKIERKIGSNQIQSNPLFTTPLKDNLIVTSPIQDIRVMYKKAKRTDKADAHMGTDFDAKYVPVYSVADGKVSRIETNHPLVNGGDYVIITHNNGAFKTVYMHLSQISVFMNDTVFKGQQIGVSGNTGGVAPHLHVEYYIGDEDLQEISTDILSELVGINFSTEPIVLKSKESKKITAKAVDIDGKPITVSSSWQWFWKWTPSSDNCTITPTITKGDNSTVEISGNKDGNTKVNLALSISSIPIRTPLPEPLFEVTDTNLNVKVGIDPLCPVTIGSQVWMGCNLNVDHYRNGDPIPQVTDPTEWQNLTTGAWCYFDNDPANGTKFGKLYNFYAVIDPRGLAPAGWHVPTINEWDVLTDYCGGSEELAAIKLVDKSWGDFERVTNETGFSILNAGYREHSGGSFHLPGAFFWSSTESGIDEWNRRLADEIGTLTGYIFYYRGGYLFNHGNSIRCVKD